MLWALAAGAALIYWRLSLGDGQGWGRSLIKGMAVAPLALLALWQGAPLVALALALCSLGDVILSRPGEGAFLGGLLAFAAGHLGWIAVFALEVGLSAEALSEPLCLLLLLSLAVLGVFMARLLWPRAGALRVPVLGYITVILAMGTTGLATGRTLITFGVFSFVLSDALLGLQTFYFEPGGRERLANALIWPLYWIAIAALTLALLSS